MTDEQKTGYAAYGRYCGYRDAAWRCLRDYDVDRLPVDVRRIAADSGFRVVTDAELHVLRPGERGVAYFDGVRWSIVTDGRQTVESMRYTVAHEMGHIFLGHGMETGEMALAAPDRLMRPQLTAVHEQEADRFAIRLLCPACMLWALDLHTAQEIAATCRVPLEIAKKRASRMTTLYKRNCFLKSELEREVFGRFEGYIREERTRYGLVPEWPNWNT